MEYIKAIDSHTYIKLDSIYILNLCIRPGSKEAAYAIYGVLKVGVEKDKTYEVQYRQNGAASTADWTTLFVTKKTYEQLEYYLETNSFGESTR